MTYKKWEKQFKKHLSPLSKEEKRDALDYYYELYLDKLDAGYWEEQIVQEFGNPQSCALRILNEGNKSPQRAQPIRKRRRNVWEWIGLSFLTLIFILPLAASAFSVAITFGAVALSGFVCILAGVLYIPVCCFIGLDTFGGILAHIGMGISTCGVGILLVIAFYYAAKYTALGTIKALQSIYRRG